MYEDRTELDFEMFLELTVLYCTFSADDMYTREHSLKASSRCLYLL